MVKEGRIRLSRAQNVGNAFHMTPLFTITHCPLEVCAAPWMSVDLSELFSQPAALQEDGHYCQHFELTDCLTINLDENLSWPVLLLDFCRLSTHTFLDVKKVLHGMPCLLRCWGML